ncbi:MAG: glycosyl transferase, partial [Mycetocola sp.]
ALWGRYDVFHVHWPEILPAGSSPLKTQLRRLTTALLLLRWRITRTAVVRTQHNIGSHEDVPFLTRALLNGITRATQLTIDLNGQTPPLGDRPQRTILHGHYREWYRHSPHPRAIPGRLSCVGLIRPYKGIGTLISAVVASPDQSISLSVAGKPINAQILDELRALAGRDPRVRLVPEFLSDDDFSRQISEAELVVLPYPAMLNSGGGLAALSLDRPVLVPDNPVTRALAEEVGHTWVQLFSGALSPEALTRALAVIRRQASGQPNLSGRTWEAAGTAHREAYREALTHRGRRVTPAPTAPEHGVRRRRTVRT